MFFQKKYKKIVAFTLTEMLISMTIVSILAAVIVPALKAATPSKNKAMLKKAYSVTEKNIFAILAKKDSSKKFIFDIDKAFMDTTADSNSGTKNKFCYYFKEQMNTLDLTGVDCPAASVTSIAPVRFAKTPDGIDWYISPASFSTIDYDAVAKKANEKMITYATTAADNAQSAKASEIDAAAQAAYTIAYNEAMANPTEIINTNTDVTDSCSLSQSCQCDESLTKYRYFKVNKNDYSSVELTEAQAKNGLIATYNRYDFETACGSSNFCYRYYTLEQFQMDLATQNADVFVRDITYAVVPVLKTYKFKYDYSLVGFAYPSYKDSGSVLVSNSFEPYQVTGSDTNYRECPPCKSVADYSNDKNNNFCDFTDVRLSLNEKIATLKNAISNYIKQLQNESNAELKTAATTYAEQKKTEAKNSAINQVRTEAYQAAINDTAVFNSYYNNLLLSASGTGDKLKDFPLKIIVDVNGVSSPPNCSADSSAYAASYMPAGYKNVGCSDPDTFIFGIRYDGKIRIANSATSYKATALTDNFAKEYLSNFIHN